MKRASYRHAVAWIGDMDSAGEADALDAEAVSELVSVCLVADIFDVETERVARDVVRWRNRTARDNAREARKEAR